MTLAELYAVVGICAPAQLPRIAPLMALIPLYAQRSGVTMDAVYALPAGEVFDSIVLAFGEFAHSEMMADAQAAMACAEAALDPGRMRSMLSARAG